MLWLIVFLSDAVIVFLAIKERDSWIAGRIHTSLLIEALSALAIGVNIILVAEFRWIMVPFSVGGAVFGRYLAWRF